MDDGEIMNVTARIRETALGIRRTLGTLATRPATAGMLANHAADLERLADELDRSAEDTQPIMVTHGSVLCPRCLGAGEVLDL